MISEWLDGLDRSITLAINGLHCEIGDLVWLYFSDTKIWVPFYLAILIFLFLRLGWKKTLIAIVAIIITIVACDQIANIFKNGVERLRPCYDSDMLARGLHSLESRGGYFGFFSSHASNAFGLATCTLFCLKNDKSHQYVKYGWLMYVWAFFVSISRVFVGKHFFGDVFTGAICGLCLGYVLALCASYFINKVQSSPSGCRESL